MKVEVFSSRETDPDMVSKGIMFFTGKSISHAGLIIDGDTIVHSVGDGVVQESVDNFLKDHVFVDRFELKVLDDEIAHAFIEEAKGKEYSEAQYVGFVLRKMGLETLARMFGDDKGEYICSEFVADFCIFACGAYYSGDTDFITPAEAIDLARSVEA